MRSLEDKTIVVFGGYGRLGSDLLPLLRARGAHVLAPPRTEVDISSPKVFPCISWWNPDIVINLAAYVNVPEAETFEGKKKCVQTNIHGSKNVCEAAHYFGAKVVYISTDYVYPGIVGDYDIEDANPQSSYGITKFVGEWFCDGEKDLVIRTSLKGRGTWGKNAFQKVFHPVYTNADWSDVIAEKITDAVSEGLTGVINLGTKRKLLRDLAREEYPEVESVDPNTLVFGYEYPIDSSMLLSN